MATCGLNLNPRNCRISALDKPRFDTFGFGTLALPKMASKIPRETHLGHSDLSAAYLAAIVDSSDDAIIGKDLSGIIRSWNRGAQSIFGYCAKEIIGQPIQILFPADRLGEENSIQERVHRGEHVAHFETVRRRKDGSDFPASVTISPIRDANGAVVGASKILRDISEQRRVQMELCQAKINLEQVVAERTKALTERDLLLREVYHRVKNNLQVVDGLLMMRALKIADPQSREGLMELRYRIFTLGLVHQQLMGSSDLKSFDIGQFLTELSDNIIGGAADDRVKLTVDACALDVGMDFALPLGLLLTEIVTNSLKHAFPNGEGTILVTLRVDSCGRLALTVADNGRGYAHGAQRPEKVGSGSSIIKKLVAQLAGELVVRHDAGTVTEILLPFPEKS
jgi:PAS domain S-box-containing protein